MTLSDRIESLLMSVQKPARYMGGEFNSIMKNPEDVDVRFAFLFPDTYEVGMSHLGMKILYHTINRRDDAWCERVFSPWVDMADLMRENDIPLFSLESRTPIRDFDLLGATLQYEMSYTNILDALDLAGIPLRAADRTDGPFVIVGGPCAFNPEPLAPFVDLVAIGDGEDETHQVIDCYKAWKASGAPREEFLRAAAKIRGVYVPSLYDVNYNEDGTVASIRPKEGSGAPEVVRKAMVANLSAADYPEKLIVPFGEVVHNRIMLEIFRGCTRGCRFCQAGMIYRPVRERSMDRLMEMAEKLVAATGYDEISLMSLSSGDYSCLPELAHRMVEKFAQKRVRISLPSQRIDNVLTDTLRETQKVKKTGLTLAPEAGTQRLRDVINKGVTEDDLMRAVTDAFEQGWSSVKLYFMIGLPTETDEDVLGIADLAARVMHEWRESATNKNRGVRITVSTSWFVPKPHTAFQWQGQITRAEYERRVKLLREAIKTKTVTYNWHDSDTSFLEAILARGDRRLGKVLETAWRKGAKLDAWEEYFSLQRWLDAFDECGLDPTFYANRDRSRDEIMPWSMISSGVTESYLWREWERACEGVTTPDCRTHCNACGANRLVGGKCDV